MISESTEKTAPRVNDHTRDNKNQNNQSLGVNHFFVAAVMMIVGTMGSLVVFVESVLALQGVYQWYPQFVAQQWFIYDEVFTILTFLGLLFGIIATSLMLSRRNLTGTLITGVFSTVTGASVSVTSLVAPLAVLWKSVLYYFLPLFLAPLVGTLLFYYVKLTK